MSDKQLIKDAERIYHLWDEALSNNDMAALLALYSPDATVDSPLIPHLLKQQAGVCYGKGELQNLLTIVAERKPEKRKFYREKYFTDGKTLMWEYPGQTPTGEQMDFMEVMELEDGLIKHHRVYWGWRGVSVLQNDEYHNDTQSTKK